MNTQTYFPRGRAVVESGAMQLAKIGLLSTLPAVRPAMPKPLTASEANTLVRCEAAIHNGLEQIGREWREIARAWERIREGKLYRMEFPTMEAYTRARFGKSARRLRQLIAAEGVMRDLEEESERSSVSSDPGAFLEDGPPRPVKRRVLPTNEAQTRPLLALPKGERGTAWDAAKAAVPEGQQPTASVVEAVVRKRLAFPTAGTAAKPDTRISKILMACDEACSAIDRIHDLLDDTDTLSNAHCRAATRELHQLEVKFTKKLSKEDLSAQARARWDKVKAKGGL